MKKQHQRKNVKLPLTTETVRVLEARTLQQVVGGLFRSDECPTTSVIDC